MEAVYRSQGVVLNITISDSTSCDWENKAEDWENKAEYSALDASRRRLRESVTDLRTDGRRDPLIEMRGRI